MLKMYHLAVRLGTPTIIKPLILTQSRSFAVFDERHIHPLFHPKAQDELVEKSPDEFKRLTFELVYPVRSHENASVFYDPLFQKVLGHLMNAGNKLLARHLLEKTLEWIKRHQLNRYHAAATEEDKAKIILDPYKILHLAVANAKPFLKTEAIKRGGHTYQVPVPVKPSASQALAIKWLIEAGNDGKPTWMRFYAQFGKELVDCSAGVGKVVKRKQDLHKLCEANRAYAHYRWG